MGKMLNPLKDESQYPTGQREVFVSYHFTTKDMQYNGFGNFVGLFDAESYYNRKSKFIEHLEKHIKEELSTRLAMDCQVKIIFFN